MLALSSPSRVCVMFVTQPSQREYVFATNKTSFHSFRIHSPRHRQVFPVAYMGYAMNDDCNVKERKPWSV